MLSANDAKPLMEALLNPETPETDLAQGLRQVGPEFITLPVLLACCQAIRETCLPLPPTLKHAWPVFDCCGTGGSGDSHYNTSTTVAFVLAAAGVKVAKFGNRSATGRSGSSDFLEKLGFSPALSLEALGQIFAKGGLVFLHAPLFYPALAHLAPVRKQIGVKTIFNYLGPLLNPVSITHRLLGVSSLPMAQLLAEGLAESALAGGGSVSWVVTGPNGEDELGLSNTRPNTVWQLKEGVSTLKALLPCRLEKLPVAALTDNAAVFSAMIDGQDTETLAYETVCLNAGAGLVIAGRAELLEDGIAQAKALLSSGQVLKTVQQCRDLYEAHT